MGHSVLAHTLIAVDHAIRGWVVAHRIGALDMAMLVVSAVANRGIGWIVVSAVVAILARQFRPILAVTIAVLLALLSGDGLKTMVTRDRPFVSSRAVAVIGKKPHDSSFPSGHAATSFAAAGVLATVAPAGKWAWWTGATLVAYSRVYLGVHYPSDVIGGALVGLACAWVVTKAMRARRPRSEQS
jgi:undecaprenyl-diphosphatase